MPDEFKTELAALDRLENEALWKIATARKTREEMARYDELLECKQNGILSQAEQLELMELRSQADCFMLRKTQAAALLQWRGQPLLNL